MPTTPRPPRPAPLSGPPLALPRVLDRTAERWAAAPPRVRVALVACAVIALLAIAGRGAARSPWGPAVPVIVAARDLAPGDVLDPSHVRLARWPRALVPSGAASTVGDVGGRTLAVGAPAGTPITTAHVAEEGIAAGLPAGRVAMPLPLPPELVLAPGQQVDVLAGAQQRGRVVATAATVLAVGDGLAWLGVERTDAPQVAHAAATGGVTVVLLPEAS